MKKKKRMHIKEWNNAIRSNKRMDVDIFILSERSQRQVSYNAIYM